MIQTPFLSSFFICLPLPSLFFYRCHRLFSSFISSVSLHFLIHPSFFPLFFSLHYMFLSSLFTVAIAFRLPFFSPLCFSLLSLYVYCCHCSFPSTVFFIFRSKAVCFFFIIYISTPMSQLTTILFPLSFLPLLFFSPCFLFLFCLFFCYPLPYFSFLICYCSRSTHLLHSFDLFFVSPSPRLLSFNWNVIALNLIICHIHLTICFFFLLFNFIQLKLFFFSLFSFGNSHMLSKIPWQLFRLIVTPS